MNTMYVQGHQRAEVLEPLIDGIERNRRLLPGLRRDTDAVLRAQLAHVRAGGAVTTAPLQEYAGDLTGMLGAAGAAGAAASLTD